MRSANGCSFVLHRCRGRKGRTPVQFLVLGKIANRTMKTDVRFASKKIGEQFFKKKKWLAANISEPLTQGRNVGSPFLI